MKKLLVTLPILASLSVLAETDYTSTTVNATFVNDFCTITVPPVINLADIEIEQLKLSESFVHAPASGQTFYKVSTTVDIDVNCANTIDYSVNIESINGFTAGTNNYNFIVTLPGTQDVIGQAGAYWGVWGTGTGSVQSYSLDLWISHAGDFNVDGESTSATIPLSITTDLGA